MINIEQKIVDAAKDALDKAISESLVGYDSPLSKLCKDAIYKNEEPLRNIVNQCLSNVVNDDNFKKELTDALHKKIATTLVGRMGGELEATVNKLKSNPETRAKVMLAMNSIIESIGKD